jgi:pimeloyl-ACP methyl ester carboxylesterase
MTALLSESYYKDVPSEQKEHLCIFRRTHLRKQVNLAGTTWSYLLGGQGSETFLILPGGERVGDLGFSLMQEFEQEYRCLYPSYPPLARMGPLLDELAALLDSLAIDRVILFAPSFGGDVGQCFVRKYPDRVSRLILMNTGIPDERLGKATRCFKPLVMHLPLSIIRMLIRRPLVDALAARDLLINHCT